MQINVPYGDTLQEISLPDKNCLFVDEMRKVDAVGNLTSAVADSLDNPIGTPSLRILAQGKKNVVILIEDNTRHTPLKLILPVLLDYLASCGIPDAHISFLTAPGTHRIMSEEELIEKVGAPIFNRYKIYQHDVTKPDSMYDLGSVEAEGYSIPIFVNKIAADADLLIGIGEIVPHSDAGYSAGAKIVQPGVCGYATTSATHIVAAFQEEFPLGIANNPCRLGIEKVAEKVGLSFILNIVKNNDGDICGVFAGDFVKAHREGCKLVDTVYSISIPHKADVVVASSWPCDIDYWQAGKGLIAAAQATKEGGTIIYAAPCPERIAHNHPKLDEWMVMPLKDALVKAKQTEPTDIEADLVGADIAIANARVREHFKVYVISSGLTDGDLELLGFERASDVQTILDKVLHEDPGANVGILRKGGITFATEN